MNRMETRTLSFAGSSVLIEQDGPLAISVVEFLFSGMSDSPYSPAGPVATYRLAPGESCERLRLDRDGVNIYEGYGRGVAADLLLAHASYDLADKSTGGMFFHSGALAWRDGLVMLPAGIGSGKSTLTLWLATRGLGYLSDESVFVPEGSDEAVPFRRPLSLRHPSREVMEGSFDFDGKGERILATAESDLIHPSALEARPGEEALPVRLFIFPRYKEDVDPSWEVLTTAQCAQELMQSLVNARNLPEHGLPETVRLAKAARGYRIVYSDFAQIAEGLDGLLGVRGE
jgi:hypothetical protein